MGNKRYIDFVFSGPPGPEGPRFIEVENEAGESISVGQWFQRSPEDVEQGYWVLRVKEHPSLNQLGMTIHDVSTSKGFPAPNIDNFSEKVMLVVTELAEAIEEHRSGKPLRYYRCPMCGKEADQPQREHGMPRKGIIAYFLSDVLHLKSMKCPNLTQPWKPEGMGVELGDALIRILHITYAMGADADDIVLEKVQFNAGREAMHGGRKY